MVKFKEEFLSKRYEELTVEERKSIWMEYFNLPEVEEVLSEATLDEMCQDKFLRDLVHVYIKFYPDVDAYDKMLDEHDRLITYVEHKLNQFDYLYNEGMSHITICDMLTGYKNNTARYEELKKHEGLYVIYRK